ncbi:unnamed protein product [Diamesa serratosioi]
MNLLIGALFVVLAVAAQAEEQIVIDWSKVKPINELPEFWVGRSFKAPVNKFNRNSRIIGGNEAPRNQFPYQAGLLMSIPGSVNTGLCGGSLISNNRVLTAAHCVDIASSVLVLLGAHMIRQEESTQLRIDVPASGLVYHPDYDTRTLLNDVAMIKFPSTVTFNNFIQPIALAEGTNNFAGDDAVLSGWGRFGPNQESSAFLRFVNLQVITNLACRIRFPTIIQDSTICANGEGNVGGCNGDSGGPLSVQRNGQSLLVGVTSFVSGVGCERGFPTGFARVSSFIPWIQSNM